MLHMEKKCLLHEVSWRSTEAFAEGDSGVKCKTNKIQIKGHVHQQREEGKEIR